MPPKVKVTKEDIVNVALSLVREGGEEALNARNIANALGCSTQPIFSNFSTMEELCLAVIGAADKVCGEYTRRELEKGEYPPYKATGMAYIRFAKEEKQLFKLLYMRDRSSEVIPDGSQLSDEIKDIVHSNTGLKDASADLFHLEMWAYVHGIATMLVTGFYDLSWELISKMMTDAYQGLKKQYKTEK